VKRPVTAHARAIVSATAIAGLVLTLLFAIIPALDPAYQNRALHVAKETAGALVLLLVAALLFGRFRRSGRLSDLLALAGVVVLAGKNLVFSVLGAILIETSGGLTTWRTTGAGMLGATLLAAAALAPERLLRDRRRAFALTTAGCLAALGTLVVIADAFELPAAFSEEPETRSELQYLSQNAELLVADVGATVLFVIAAVAFGRRAEREEDEFQLWLGVGAMIAATAYLNYALFPSSYTDFLYVGDIFRVAAVVAWGIGTIREISRFQSGFARAAVLDERRRLARDIHDGVAQELAFISSQMPELKVTAGNREVVQDIMESVQRALDETRGAISALGRPVHEPFERTLASSAEEIASRLGAEVRLDLDSGVEVPPAWEEALPRIVREAVSNAVRHGQARHVTVHLRDADGIWLRVTDDGQGFDVTEPRAETSFGLVGMRERAESLGGEFRLSSKPGAGTSVEILLP
jgi:signal transduction histidine kinase